MKRCGAVSVSGIKKCQSMILTNSTMPMKWVWILNAYRKVGKDENTNQNCSTDLSVAQQNGFGFILFAVDEM